MSTKEKFHSNEKATLCYNAGDGFSRRWTCIYNINSRKKLELQKEQLENEHDRLIMRTYLFEKDISRSEQQDAVAYEISRDFLPSINMKKYEK